MAIFRDKTILLAAILCGCTAKNTPVYYEADGTSRHRSAAAEAFRENGQCFANCLVPDQYSVTTFRLPTPDGSDATLRWHEEKIEVRPASSSWQRKPAPGGGNQMCLVERPAVFRTVCVVDDTSGHRGFRYEPVSIEKLEKKGGFAQKTAVLCPEQVTPELIGRVVAALTAKGFPAPASGGATSPGFQSALTAYQRSEGLPVGQLDFSTIKSLNIGL